MLHNVVFLNANYSANSLSLFRATLLICRCYCLPLKKYLFLYDAGRPRYLTEFRLRKAISILFWTVQRMARHNFIHSIKQVSFLSTCCSSEISIICDVYFYWKWSCPISPHVPLHRLVSRPVIIS